MAAQPTYGPHNPHPLSQMRTELVWEGKYDEYGNRREVDVAGLAMPLQKIETIDQPRAEAEEAGQLSMFEKKSPRRDDFRNRLIWGDNKLVMASLLKEFKGKIDLIYIDPPFDVGADFTMDVPLGEEDTTHKDQSTLELVAYRDTWGRGTDSFISMIYERLALMQQLLAENGSIYIHCDWHLSGYIRGVLDDVFGEDNFRNEIIWKRRVGSASSVHESNRYGICTDTVYYYARSDNTQLEPQFNKDVSEYQDYIAAKFTHVEADGRRYRTDNLANPAPRPNLKYEYKGYKPPKNGWAISREKMEQWDREGRLYFPKNPDGRIARKRYLDELKGMPVQNLWTDIAEINSQAIERLGYPTQKPEAFVERMINASSKPGDLVADFFCGSGTTGAVAERLDRRWILTDLGRFSVHTTRKRLIELQRNLHTSGQPYRAFDVYNLGRYERQWWQKERLKGADEEHRRVVLEFFKAEQLFKAPSPLIHGRKNGAFVHVDSIDSVFTREEASALAKAVAAAGGRECYALSWEFEMDLRLALAAIEQQLGVKIKPVFIPREIMEKNLKGTPPFFEMAVVSAEPVYRTLSPALSQSTGRGSKGVDIKLTKFLPSLAEVPTKELDAIRERAVKSGMDFIHFWAVDFDWSPGKPFNHDWQDYRTRKDRSLKTVSDAGHKYPKAGKYTACVKVVDTFGSDTSITVAVEV